MRTIVDIPDQTIQSLDLLCGRVSISRAEAVRRAVTDYLARYQQDDDSAFGLWRGRGIDGVSYQDALRDEWSVPTLHEPLPE